MLLSASSLLHLPVRSRESGKNNLALAKAVIVDPKQIKVLGFLLYTGIFGRNKIIDWQDVVDIDSEMIQIKKDEDIMEIQEIVRIAKTLGLGIKIFGQKVFTKSGKYLGDVEDFLIEKETSYIAKLYLKKSVISVAFATNLIVTRSSIIKIMAEKIIVKDNVIKVKAKARAKVRQRAAQLATALD